MDEQAYKNLRLSVVKTSELLSRASRAQLERLRKDFVEFGTDHEDGLPIDLLAQEIVSDAIDAIR